MNVMELSLISLALALDASFYAFSYGLVLRDGRWGASLWLALIVGLFQGLMPLLGYTCGIPLREMLQECVSPILLFVFGGIGLNMIYQSWFAKESKEPIALGLPAVLLVGVLTSIDALALGGCMSISCIAGVDSFPKLLAACGLIASITFVLSLLFFHASSLFHKLPTRILETMAGLLLIGLGWSYYQ